MSYTLKIHGERSICQAPPGLYELMSDISREVLRDQPDQLYNHIADYMDTLLKLRTKVKNASEVLNDVIDGSKSLLAYVAARGVTWEEANKYARVIQRAYRRLEGRKELQRRVRMDKEEKLGKVPLSESSSFIEYLDSLGIDYETANKASLTIQLAFKAFVAKKKMQEMVRCSTHTISMVEPAVDAPSVFEESNVRNSKLQVYEESTSPSINSAWYKPVTDETVKSKRTVASSATSVGSAQRRPFARDSELLVFEQSTRPSVDAVWYAAQEKDSDVSMEARRLGLTKGMSFLDREDSTPNPTLESPLPTYFEMDKGRVISESGQLEEDVVTLFSTDICTVARSLISLSESDHSRGEGSEKLPSLQGVGRKPSKTEAETAKELFNIIKKKSYENGSSVNKSVRLVSKTEKLSGTHVSRLFSDSASRKSKSLKRVTLPVIPSQTSYKTVTKVHQGSSSSTSKKR